MLGVVLSILLLIALGGYSAYKVEIMINRKSNELTLAELSDFYTDEETLNYEDGLNFAFGLHVFDFVEQEPLDETYGSWTVTLSRWSIDD